MTTKTLTCGIRIDDNRSINCGVSISNQSNPLFHLWYSPARNEFGFNPKYYTQSPTYLYMDDLNAYITALSDIIQAMAEANEFVSEG